MLMTNRIRLMKIKTLEVFCSSDILIFSLKFLIFRFKNISGAVSRLHIFGSVA